MNNKNLLKVVNVILALLFINQAITGIFYGLIPKDLFELLHMGGFLLVFVALIHIYLNWAWVKSNLLPGRKKRGE